MPGERHFGPFFRARREALGLTLRELCRQHGFDPSNISRLERGLVRPPQAKTKLEQYAKALKIKTKTADWERFFELAGAETGRVPADILEERTAQLPKELRRLRVDRRRSNWVRATHLESEADFLEMRFILPEIIRRLVRATCKGIVRAEFPSQRPGWDGIVEATGIDESVPEGASGWEMGSGRDPGGKADEDYKKRTKNSLGLTKSKTTFVFVTPRKWLKKTDWERAKRKEQKWKDVRVHDSASLEEWLERALAVDVWLLRQLGIRPDGLSDIDEYWGNLQASTEPSLTPAVFLTSRGKEAEQLKEWLTGQSGTMVIEADSAAEAIDFVAAVSRDPAVVDTFAARTLIVENRDAWRSVSASGTELLLIAHPALAIEPELVAEATRQGHRVLLWSDRQPKQGIATLKLPRLYRYDLYESLQTSGLDHVRAADVAGKAGGSLSVLKRLLARLPGTKNPAWSEPSNARTLAPILLAGQWDDTVDGDRRILEMLAEKPYREVAPDAARWREEPDAPVMQVLSRWRLVSREDSWHFLSNSLTADDLRTFAEAALKVLSEDDPKFDLPPDRRWLSAISAKPMAHSLALREGMAESLALLGARPGQLPLAATAKSRVEHVITQLLSEQDWKRWASLSPVLPLLAEAAPNTFVKAVEDDIGSADSQAAKLFIRQGDPPFSSRPHTGLLWALECLAWHPNHLSPVSKILASLAESCLKSDSLNAPIDSLATILCSWYPQTNGNIDHRIAVQKQIIDCFPEIGWQMLIRLLPQQLRSTRPTCRPRYQDWANGWSEGASRADQRRQEEACARLLLTQDLARSPAHREKLIAEFERLPESVQGEFIQMLLQVDPNSLDAESRRKLTESFRKKVRTHRKYSHCAWAIPEPVVTELEKVLARFEPNELVARHAWLFGSTFEVEELLGSKQEEIDQRRIAVLNEIEANAGWDGILALVDAAGPQGEVGYALGMRGSKETDSKILPMLLMSDRQTISLFARGYANGRFRHGNWEWVKSLPTSSWNPEEVTQLLIDRPFNRATWDYATERGAEECYWKNAYGFGKELGLEDLAFVARMLLKHERPIQTIRFLSLALRRKSAVPHNLLFQALEAARPNLWTNETAGELHFQVEDIFLALQSAPRESRQTVDLDRLVKLEWQYLWALDGHRASPTTLHDMLTEDPKTFVDLLCWPSEINNEARSQSKEISEHDRAAVMSVYRLLASWESIPGSQADGSIDEAILSNWIRKARTMAEERGQREYCDERIGELLACDQTLMENDWPSIPVRDAIEEFGSANLINGFEIGILNKRDAYQKAAGEGGNQERDLASRFHELADACNIEWPKTAAALRRVADHYEEEAAREDARVALD